MKFGLFYEFSSPRGPDAETEAHGYNNCLEQVKLATNRASIMSGAVEHPFPREFRTSPRPSCSWTACAVLDQAHPVGPRPSWSRAGIQRILSRAPNSPATLSPLFSGGRRPCRHGPLVHLDRLGAFGANPSTTKKSWDD